MAKKVENNVEHSFSLFNSIGGIIGTIITIGSLTFPLKKNYFFILPV